MWTALEEEEWKGPFGSDEQAGQHLSQPIVHFDPKSTRWCAFACGVNSISSGSSMCCSGTVVCVAECRDVLAVLW